MKKWEKQKALVCADQTTVYDILPEKYWTCQPDADKKMAEHLFSSVDARVGRMAGGFPSLGYRTIIAGKNFGCGVKSVEYPIRGIIAAGINCVIAESLSRYTYRNALNLALPVLICPGISSEVRQDDLISVDLLSGVILNETSGKVIQAEPISGFALEMLECGGLTKLIDAQREKK